MAALTYETQNVAISRSRTDWGAIWGGVFTFAAIWSVFGFLGYAIFASAEGPQTATATGINLGMSIWAIVLTIIAMYVAGLETGRLAAVSNRHDGLVHGIIMFGLSAVAAFLVVVLGQSAMTGMAPAVRNSVFTNMSAGLGWVLFLSLFLGWLAAMGGASTGATRRTESRKEVEPIRKAA